MEKKKNLIFLFSGESRTSPLSNHSTSKKYLINNYNEYIFTDKFKSLYNYKIFITTDDINIEETINYFGNENIGNIHLLNNNYYLKPINNYILPESYYIEKYNNMEYPYPKNNRMIYPQYKKLDCYNLFKNENIDNIDYIICMRLDTYCLSDILDILDKIENNNEYEILMIIDVFTIGKPKIMDYLCNGLLYKYGQYKCNDININFEPNIFPDYQYVSYDWYSAPEAQLCGLLIDYCQNNNLDFNNVVVNLNNCGSSYKHFNRIIRIQDSDVVLSLSLLPN